MVDEEPVEEELGEVLKIGQLAMLSGVHGPLRSEAAAFVVYELGLEYMSGW